FEDVRLSVAYNDDADDESVRLNKPYHNSSSSPDWVPSNPWSILDDTTEETANVSEDLLIRGRVRGWFVNTNPTGRAQDASDPLNVRPANRWIMPDDWAWLAGGPVDPEDGSDA